MQAHGEKIFADINNLEVMITILVSSTQSRYITLVFVFLIGKIEGIYLTAHCKGHETLSLATRINIPFIPICQLSHSQRRLISVFHGKLPPKQYGCLKNVDEYGIYHR